MKKQRNRNKQPRRKANKDRIKLALSGQIGPKPSPEYMQHVDLLDNVVRECMHVSRRYGGLKAATSRHFYASALFTLLCTRGVSLCMLMPHTPWAEKLIEHWDYASMAGITRTILETRLTFYYLCVEECTDEEWNYRWNVFNLHDCVSRLKLFQNMSDKDEEVDHFEKTSEELRERLRTNIAFQQLPLKQQKQLLTGREAIITPLPELAEKVGIDSSQFRWLYRLLSANVHSLPMSFYRMQDDGSGRGLPSDREIGYTSLCLSLSASLIVGARDELHELFKGLDGPDAERQPGY